ncbi:MAG TPA: hypothetical protein VFN78_14530, partial [Ktedonobacterales bacterium]|nr:hypothetical protein [Ktedonobacterales bacterium]
MPKRVLLRTTAKVAAIGAAALASASAGIGYYVARRLTEPNAPSFMDDFNMTPFETGIDWEDIRIPTAKEAQPLVG